MRTFAVMYYTMLCLVYDAILDDIYNPAGPVQYHGDDRIELLNEFKTNFLNV